tara:strand:+ start:1110 stop:1403 length:294 start_codon:yes stop_codon:yes gene_type:complete
MSVCLGYSMIEDKDCSSISNCNQSVGCGMYSLEPPAETNFNLNKEYSYPNVRGLQRTNCSTGSWPCRGQQSCNYFDKSNPIISDYIRNMDLMALPPN